MLREWQTIDTAPKDGTEILLASKNGSRVCYWDSGRFFEGWFIPASDAHDCGGTYAAAPTHWMPLPEPPKC